MAVRITGIEAGSPAQRAGVKEGDELLSINGHKISDVLDYRFYILEKKLKLSLLRAGKNHSVTIRKEEYTDPGMLFETYLMDHQRNCRNQCIFCFIDQLPAGLRKSLYFKDDDARLSFLFGNYITLTNLSEEEIERIIAMHISPVNISVHTTNPELRNKMMGNRFAGNALSCLDRFAQGGIKMNCQLVLCPGYNDGDELMRSLRDLLARMPAIESIAAVPVGLTDHREGLTELTGFTRETAAAVIDTMEQFSEWCLSQYDSRICYAADEFYLKAGRPVPPASFYEDFPQLENGVGMIALTREQFLTALEESEYHLEKPRTITIVTGKAAASLISSLIDEAQKKWHNLSVRLIVAENTFFGAKITVSGLLTGTDLLRAMEGQELGECLLIPASTLRSEGDMFLDDMTLAEFCDKVSVPVVPVSNDGAQLLEAMLGGVLIG